MMRKIFNLKRGAFFALAIGLSLIFFPPFFAKHLDAWQAAEYLIDSNQGVVEFCGEKPRIELSRWFYTYKFSGDDGVAEFRGHALGKKCNENFVVKLKKINGEWIIENIIFKGK